MSHRFVARSRARLVSRRWLDPAFPLRRRWWEDVLLDVFSLEVALADPVITLVLPPTRRRQQKVALQWD